MAGSNLLELGYIDAFHSQEALAKYAGLVWQKNNHLDSLGKILHSKEKNAYLRYSPPWKLPAM